MCLSLVVISLSNTSLNVALPTLARDLRTGPGALQWIVDAYSLVFAGSLLTAGAAGDRFGRRLALNAGLCVFGLASLLAALSSGTGQVVAARGLMGVGAALIMPATLSVIAHVFPPEERARAVAIWAGFSGAGGAAGSIVSGWLLEHFWWGSVFLSNVVAVVVALVAGAVLVPSTHERRHRRLDPLGAILSIVGLAILVYTIIEAPHVGWGSGRTGLGLGVAAVVMWSFVRWERNVSEPMLDLGLFRNRSFTAAASTITLIFCVMYGMVFVITQYLQAVLGASPLEAGVRLLPLPIAFLVATPNSARVVRRWGMRRTICCGLSLLSLGMAFLSLAARLELYPLLALGLVVSAVGMALTTAPSTGAIMFAVPLDQAGVASAVNDTTRELGGSLGVAALGSIFTSAGASALVHGSSPGAALISDTALAHAAQVTLLAACALGLVGLVVVSRLLRPIPPRTSVEATAAPVGPPGAGVERDLDLGSAVSEPA